jgi:amino acid adenylation domain-containing protein
MNMQALRDQLAARQVRITLREGRLVAAGARGALDAPLQALLREHKAALLALLADDPHALSPADARITPAMLPLIELTQEEIDTVVAGVDGGAANVQDIYPLAPLQQGMLFHHLLEADNDAYLMHSAMAFDGRARLDAFLAALERVIERHDILRTSLRWNGLRAPLQVVQRQARLAVEQLELAPGPDPHASLLAAVGPRAARIDLQRAPLLRACIAADPASGEWLLVLLHHHVVCDHLTLELVIAEIGAILQGRENMLAPPQPYRNFIAHLRTVPEAEHERYFRATLGDVDTPTVPFGVTEVRGGIHGIREARLALTPQLGARLRACARNLAMSPAPLFHLAWAQVLGRVCGSDDVVFGTVLSGRLQGTAAAGRTLGMFINTLPLRLTLRAPARAALAQARQALDGLLEHEQAPLALAQRCSQVRAPLPLFTCCLNYRHGQLRPDEAPEWDGIRLLGGRERTDYPLMVAVNDSGDGFALDVQAAEGIDPQRVAAYLAQACEALAEAYERQAPLPVALLDVLPAAERDFLLHGLDGCPQAVPQSALAHRLFERQAAQQGEAPAVIHAGRILSYAELNRRANRIAHRLRAAGAGRGTRVAILAERGPDMVAAILGTLKAGAAYVPLEPGYPDARLAFILEDSAPQALLADAACAALAARLPAAAALVPLEAAAASGPDHEPQCEAAAPEDLAYVIYTSGSTGRPKGVMVEHRTLLNLWAALGAEVYGRPARRINIGLNASYAFDASLQALSQLLSGHCLTIIPAAVRADPAAMLAFLDAEAIDAFDCVPSQLALLLAAGWFTRPGRRPGLVLVGGEAIAPSLWEALRQAEGTRFYNAYGPTECTVDATLCLINGAGEQPVLGQPIANTRVYVLDEQSRPAPLDCTGEIYIAGAGVARGYLNHPELTAERFLPDPFRPGERMYRTGDLGRRRADGSLEYAGRNDFQVKLRGYRIETGEIEARLAAFPEVRGAVVALRADPPGDPRLVAYLVSDDGAAPAPAELRRHLLAQLPDHMVPSSFVHLQAFPLTANGKLDRAALPAPGAESLPVRAYLAPHGAAEQAIAAVWCDLLGLERVGRDDHFFDLGGHSLLAIQLGARIRTALGADVALRDLFAHPTLAGMAELAAALQPGSGLEEAIAPAQPGQDLPLSFAQQRLWFLDQLDPAAGARYNMPAALRLKGALDRAALQASLERVVARHASLRTTFASVDGQPRQQVHAPGAAFDLAQQDLGALGGHERQSALERIAMDEALAPFDLAGGPLMRARLLRLADDDHVLLVTQHHIVSDGWSVGVLVREVVALYAAFREGRPDPLPPLAIQYADYATWQRDTVRGARLLAQVEFWKAHLGGAPALLTLPTDRPRPARQSHAGASVSLALSPEIAAGVRAVARRHGATLFMTLLSAWAVLLARLSGQRDIVIGTPVANRPRVELEPLIGFFVNTLALRVRLEDDPTLDQVVVQVKATTLAAYAHQDLPFEQVVEALQPARHLGHSPLFQTMLGLDNTPQGDVLALPGLSVTPLAASRTSTHFDLSLAMFEDGAQIGGRLEYACDLFDAASAQRIAGHFLNLLSAMAADPQTRTSAVALLSPVERDRVVHGFNPPPPDGAPAWPVHRRIERQVALHPHAPAVVLAERSYSYAELNQLADHLAATLDGLGVGRGARVAICSARTVHAIAAVLAVLKTGAAFVPLDPAYPAERLRYLVDDCAPAVVLAEQMQLKRFADLALPCVGLEQALDAALAAAPSHARPDCEVQAQDLAYVIYTSGSTGMPKGAMIAHQSLAGVTSALIAACGIDAGSRVLNVVSFSFDVCVADIMTALCSGAALHLAAPDDLLGAALPATMRRRAITHAALPAAVLATLPPDADLGPLRCLSVGGEALSPALARHWAARCRLLNCYGPTETAITATVHACDPLHEGAVPIGRPLPHARIYILDEHGQPQPVGVAGEICIGGAGVGAGYWNRPALNQERFCADPFVPGGRMYRSGDLGRWLPDGSIGYLGRGDAQVKVRGFRVELGEVDAALMACDGVREAAVLLRGDGPAARLVGYYSGAAQPDEVRARLADALPEHMLPAALVPLTALPLTANGKIDRAALPAPDPQTLSARSYQAPQDALEAALAALWQELLGLERVGRNDHFFELGGHSLLAVQLAALVRQRLGVELALRELFANPVLAQQAGLAREAPRAGADGIGAADRSQPLPLSFAQQRLWFLDQFDPRASQAYHMSMAVRLTGALDARALQAALDRLVGRHETLRTSFRGADGEVAQHIAPAGCGFALAREDLGALPAEAHAGAVERIARSEALAPFDMALGPMIRGRLLRLDAQHHVLLLTQHHILTDGWSLGIMIEEIGTLYAAFLRGQADPLPPLPIQYADYALWQRRFLQGDRLQEQVRFWRGQLDGAPALLALPTDFPRPATPSHAGDSVALRVPLPLAARARALADKHGATLYMVLASAWAILLARLSGQDDIVIGTPFANRERPELAGLIGYFANTMALRVRFDGAPSVAHVLQQVRSTSLAIHEHPDLPFEQVVEIVNPERSLSYSPIFQTKLSLDNTADRTPALPGLELEVLGRHAPTTALLDLAVGFTEAGQLVEGRLEYASDLFTAYSAARIADRFLTVLAAMAEDPEQPALAVPLLDAAQRRHLLDTLSPGPAAPHDGRMLHQCVAAHAEASPDAPAVDCGGAVLDYRELNRRANQLAHYLLALGIRPDDRVAACFARGGPAMIVSMLAILKAGACYVPLDPSYPPARLQFMLADSAPVALLTEDSVQDALPALSRLRTVVVDDPYDGTASRIAAAPQHDPQPPGLAGHHLAYLIYTSGSTGQPKGVMIEHRSLANMVVFQGAEIGAGPGDHVLQFASASFDASIWEIAMALGAGACLHLAAPDALRGGEALADTLRRRRISHATLPASAVASLGAPERFAHMTLIVAGEACPPMLAQSWSGLHRFFNAYGPTETTVCASIHLCAPLAANTVPIGRPPLNVRIYILDAHGQPAPVGVPGEIHIGGAGVGRGYLNLAELSATRFVPDPFGTEPGARMYRSGDIGRWNEAGEIEFLGRNDHQVKLRGFRIEPGEIEARLAAHEDVAEAVVVVREDTPGDRRLVAYVSADVDAGLDAQTLRRHLARGLPEYMLPAAYVILPALPLTANGKIDRRALPAPDQAARPARAYAAPEGPVEQALAALWQDLLGLERVGRHDHFFELGGHSLLAVQLVAHVRRSLGIEAAVRDLFVAPCLAEFAAALGQHGSARRYASLVPIRPAGALAPLFLVHPSGGEVAYVRALEPWLPPQLPVYGLAAQGFAADTVPMRGVPEMARHYIAQIRQVQPNGPYRLGGYSGGASIAYEMARQLLDAGDSVAFLGLIDSRPGLGRDHAMRRDPIGEADTALRYVRNDAAPAVQAALDRLATDGDVDAMVELAERHGLIPAEVERPTLRRQLAIMNAQENALLDYVTTPLDVPATFFATAGTVHDAPDGGWGAFLGPRLRLAPLPGDHATVVKEPHVRALAAALAAALGLGQAVEAGA